MSVHRRRFLAQVGSLSLATRLRANAAAAQEDVTDADRVHMRSVAGFTAETLSTDHPMASVQRS